MIDKKPLKYGGAISIHPKLNSEELEFFKNHLLFLNNINAAIDAKDGDYKKKVLSLIQKEVPIKITDQKSAINHFIQVCFFAKVVDPYKDHIKIKEEYHNKLLIRQGFAHLIDFIFKKNSYFKVLGMLKNNQRVLNGTIYGTSDPDDSWQYQIKNNRVIKFDEGLEITTVNWVNTTTFVKNDIAEYGKIVAALPSKPKLNKKLKI